MKDVFIYGSCVGRDTYEYIDQNTHRLVDYVARQSLISAFSAPVNFSARRSDLTSAFQIKNLQGDLDGDLPKRILAQSGACDILFWDLADERLGVIDCGRGRYITRSVELVRSGILEKLPESRWIRFGTPEYLDLWRISVRKFAAFLRHQKLIERVLLFDIPWSMYNELGEKTKSVSQIAPDDANNLYAEYIQVIQEEMPLQRVGIGWNQSISNTNHKWTESPYHYKEDVYQEMVRRIKILVPDTPQGSAIVRNDSPVHQIAHSPTTLERLEGLGAYVDHSLDEPLSDFCVEIEGYNESTASSIVAISLKINPSDNFIPKEHGLALSTNPEVGYFRYIRTTPGLRRYFIHFSLPESTPCSSIRITAWKNHSVLEVRSISVFGPEMI